MSFVEFLPDVNWREHIAAYWILETKSDAALSNMRIYADGCADLIYNAGTGSANFYPKEGYQQAIPLNPGRLYLGGTMTAYGLLECNPGCVLTGIRFLPGGFYALFLHNMQPAVDSTIEFHHEELCALMQYTENMATRLDYWFNQQAASGILSKPGKYDFAYLRKRMYESGGLVSVEALANEMCISQKTLERIFKTNVGIPPKEFLRIVRFQEVLKRLRNVTGKNEFVGEADKSFLQIAFELGYYDHAHLTNEFKKYAGILPSELSNFYRKGISGGRYF